MTANATTKPKAVAGDPKPKARATLRMVERTCITIKAEGDQRSYRCSLGVHC